ncbi:MAG: hypothetical protein KDB00_08885 [Planctomycetales bacterium]|nr:hypothetical protein [Planctomycetales bacterium]
MARPTLFVLSTLFLLTTIFNVAVNAADATELLRDDFSSLQHPTRKAQRGDWKIADGMASVKQDDELYRKYQNHGPIMVYEIPHVDAKAVVEFKPQGCKTVVFTMDAAEGGHAFRVILRSESLGQPSMVLTYAEKPADDKAKPIVLDRDVPKLKEGQWHRIEVSVKGQHATVKIGDQSFEVQHARIAQQKGIVKLGFSFGELAIRNFTMDAI